MPHFLTIEGYNRLKTKLDEMKTIRRKEIALRIKEAKEFGDLSENAAYHEAKDAQGLLEAEIRRLDTILKNVKIIEKKDSPNQVMIGSRVKVDIQGREQTYSIIGSAEADPLNGKISCESPLGQALLNRAPGECFSYDGPRGKINCKLLETIG